MYLNVWKMFLLLAGIEGDLLYIFLGTVVFVYINTLKTAFFFNFDFYQAFKQ